MTNQHTIEKTLLAFDYGEKRIGVAVSVHSDANVQTLPIIDASTTQKIYAQLDELMRAYVPDIVVVGRPRTMDGELSEQSSRAETFANDLRSRYGMRVILQDETLSSDEAKKRLPKNTPLKQQRKLLDSIAAQIILEDYLT